MFNFKPDFKIKRYLVGGVIVSGLVLVSFLVYVDNFSPYFQQNSYFYRFPQNSTISRLLISTQQPNAAHHHGNRSHIETTRATSQRNESVSDKRIFEIVINNNVTNISPKELVVQNRHNDTNTKERKTTMSSPVNSTLPKEIARNTTIKGQSNSVNESLLRKSDAEQTELLGNSSTSATGAPTVLKEPKYYDRPNADLSGYVLVTDLKKPLDIHCSTCAIVSSSGQMLNTKAGSEIDDNECVIRMNDAPVKKFERDVGSRTTIRVVGHSASHPLKTKARSILLGTGQPKHVIMWGPERSLKTNGGYGYNTMKLMAKLYKNTKFYIHTQKQMDFADKSFEKETGKNRLSSGSWLTTGWFTIQLARNICDDIHMYGMISDDYCKKHKSTTPYHYYEPRGVKECHYYNGMEKQKKNAHRFITEKGVYAKWAKLSPTITFHHPKWEPSSSAKS